LTGCSRKPGKEKKEKKGISVKKFPVFSKIASFASSKFFILEDLFADSRGIRTYRPDSVQFFSN
jgi:hypothetical protein